MKKFGMDMDRRELLRGLGNTAAALGPGLLSSRRAGDLVQAAPGEAKSAESSLEPRKVKADPSSFTVRLTRS